MTCSSMAMEVGEPLAGTAPLADAWVVIEQPGSWGTKALQDADLPAGVGPAIAAAAAGTGVGVLLARHPDRTVRDRPDGHAGHRVWIASVRPGLEELRHGVVEDLSAVTSWDFPAIAAGRLPALDAPAPPALLLVCTQGGRDACCARIGRPLIQGLLDDCRPPDRELLWEASHIGGHRFAPTVLALPTGAVHGRLDPGQAVDVLQATMRGEIELTGLRGRSALPAAAQAAEIAIRAHTGERGTACLSVTSSQTENDQARVALSHQDGRSWSVELRRVQLPRPRPESCGAEAVIGFAWHVLSVH